MHREVNTGLSIAIIFILALAVFVFSQIGLRNIDKIYQSHNFSSEKKLEEKLDPQKAPRNNRTIGEETEISSCHDRIFEGDVKLRMWRDGEPVDSKTKGIVVIVAKEDLAKLPMVLEEGSKNDLKARLVDVTQEVEMDLAKHSKDNPAEITIKGYKYTCQGMNSMSLGSPSEALVNI